MIVVVRSVSHTVKYTATIKYGSAQRVPSTIGCHDTKIELEGVCERRNTLSSARILANDYGLSPARDMVSYPASN